MTKLMVNLRYFITPVMIFLAMLGIVAGGNWVWLGVVMFVAAIIADWITSLTPVQAAPAGTDRDGELNGIPWLLNAMMYGQLPVFVMLQLALAWRVYEYVSGVPIGSYEAARLLQCADRHHRPAIDRRYRQRRHLHGPRHHVRP